MKQLHLLNGDTTLQQFKQTNIPGATFVWREILCEGPTVVAIGSKSHWETRATFLKKFSPDGFEKYFQSLREEMDRVDLDLYDEVVLWFEYDLFCQINLLGAISWLRSKLGKKMPRFSLICLSKHSAYDRLVGLGEIKASEYPNLLRARQVLSELDLSFAEQLWRLYCSQKHDQLLDLIETQSSANFPYLAPAIKAHYRRFPNSHNGLTEIEETILQLLFKEAKTPHSIVSNLLRMENYYGFGDLQYFKLLESLAPLLEENKAILSLNEKGKTVLENRESFRSFRVEKAVYGGASIAAFQWNINTSLLEVLTE